LACLVLKPKLLSAEAIVALVKTINYVAEADWFNAYMVKEHAEKETLRTV